MWFPIPHNFPYTGEVLVASRNSPLGVLLLLFWEYGVKWGELVCLLYYMTCKAHYTLFTNNSEIGAKR